MKNKKVIALVLSFALGMSMISCGNKEAGKPQVTEFEKELSQNHTREEVQELYQEGLERVEEVCDDFYLEYEKAEKIVQETKNGELISINDNNIYLDNENPDPNKLESMYYGFRQYGSDLASGQIIMKLGFNLDKEEIKENEEFDFGETAMSSFSEAFTDDYERDYSALNEQIYDSILNDKNMSTITNDLNGIKETITITDNYLLYKLESKEYSFK